MSKLKQFRCPGCIKLLFKFDIRTNEMIRVVSFTEKKVGLDFHVVCPKCNTESKIVKDGLSKVGQKMALA